MSAFKNILKQINSYTFDTDVDKQLIRNPLKQNETERFIVLNSLYPLCYTYNQYMAMCLNMLLHSYINANEIRQTVEQFIKECEDSGEFNDLQMLEIRDGFEKSLTIEQVEIYAKPVFDRLQMREIRDGFTVSDLTNERTYDFN